MRVLWDVCQLNEHILKVATEGSVLASAVTARADAQPLELLGTLDAPARHCAAQIPLLLFDLHFQDAKWWEKTVLRVSVPCQEGSPANRLTLRWESELARVALMLAWPAVREERVAASVLFGMSESVAALIAALTPQQLDGISLHHGHEAGLRWSNSRPFWRHLTAAASSGQAAAMSDVYLYGLQLLGGEALKLRQESGAGQPADKCGRRVSRATRYDS